MSLHANTDGTLSSVAGAAGALSYVDLGTDTEDHALGGTGPSSLLFETAPLASDVRIEGLPRLEVEASTLGTETHYTPVLFDLGPPVSVDPSLCTFVTASNACTITRGFLNARYRDGLSSGVDLSPGARYHASVRFIDNDWVVRAGHRIAVAVMSSNVWWAMPDAERAQNTIFVGAGGTALVLPVVGGSDAAAAAGL
ncbi:MAG: CocE/NonD family hydrolase C-terminal non-catalytic domain-containing protein [Actinomycetota bacterium]